MCKNKFLDLEKRCVTVLHTSGTVLSLRMRGQEDRCRRQCRDPVELGIESSINGSTLNVENDSAAMKEFTEDVTPTFECSDDMHCVFTLNGKLHDGTVTEEGTGRYRIDFYDNYKSFLVEIIGERMTLRNEKGNVSLVFKVKQD